MPPYETTDVFPDAVEVLDPRGFFSTLGFDTNILNDPSSLQAYRTYQAVMNNTSRSVDERRTIFTGLIVEVTHKGRTLTVVDNFLAKYSREF